MSDLFATNIDPQQLANDELRSVEAPWGTVVILRHGDRFVCFSPKCPHASADLREGSWGNGRITCPKHGWKFDTTSGRTLYPADEAAA